MFAVNGALINVPCHRTLTNSRNIIACIQNANLQGLDFRQKSSLLRSCARYDDALQQRE